MRKTLNETEKAVLQQLKAGITKQTDISAAIGKSKTTVCQAVKRINSDFPELLKPEAMKNTTNSEKQPKKANTKPQKQVFSFRTNLNDIIAWKAYATATGQTMEAIGTAAMNEYIEAHKLQGKQKKIYDALTAED